MKIEKNITATLEREMGKRGMNYAKFSKEIGIPRTTLQGYLKGTSHPRTDSLEELADRLGLSPAELVSGEEYPAPTGIPSIDQILEEIPALHPHVLPFARQLVSMLKAIFQMSEDLYGNDRPNAETLCQNPAYKYCLHELRDPFRRALSYGILVKECSQERWFTVAVIAPFSSDKVAVLNLIDRCTKLQLSPEHLLDVVQDFLTQQALTT